MEEENTRYGQGDQESALLLQTELGKKKPKRSKKRDAFKAQYGIGDSPVYTVEN